MERSPEPMPVIRQTATRQASAIARDKIMARGPVTDLGSTETECATHGPYTSQGWHFASGAQRWEPCPQCLAEEKAEEEARQAASQAREREYEVAQRIAHSNVPQRFLGKRLTDFRADTEGQQRVLAIAQDYVDRFAVNRDIGASLIFLGTPGTGKSLLAMIILQELCGKGYGGRYFTLQGVIQAVRRTWGKEGEGRESDVMDDICGTSLLVIDEIGVQAGTDNEMAILFDIVDRRYAEMRPTIFCTNLVSKSLEQFLGDRIWDRMKECGRRVPFDGPSYRPTARKELGE